MASITDQSVRRTDMITDIHRRMITLTAVDPLPLGLFKYSYSAQPGEGQAAMANGASSPLHRLTGRIDVSISQFGRDVTSKLLTGIGSQEDHIRGPFERLISDIGKCFGLRITAIGETRLPRLSIRPDYAINVDGVRVGYVELKRPGHGLPEKWRHPSAHDTKQWNQFKLLPNVLYSDGQSFACYHYGKLVGKVGQLAPGLDHAGKQLRATDIEFARVINHFLLWEPERPRTIEELVRITANLCRLLRDDVAAQIQREQSGESPHMRFSGLAEDWRQVLFPNLKDPEFADQYAQTVTFALLLARVEGVSFQQRSISEIARQLGKKHSLMGKALAVLTDQPDEELSVALTTMIRVVGAVDWSDFPDDSYSLLYESFLTRYDPALRRRSGVYYTPNAIVRFMTRFVDDVLRIRLGRRQGFAENDVIVVDPAMGTGSFLAEVVNSVARTIELHEGIGAVTPKLRDLSNRLIGFENQAAPYAVAELRIHSLLKKRHRAEIPITERRFLADTLDDPDLQTLPLGSLYETIKQVRQSANFVKRHEPVMVVIGNPPYVDKVRGSAPWVETPRQSLGGGPSLSAFRKQGNGKFEYVLSNKYIYFWRWATWKAFDAHEAHPAGVVAMICSAGFTTGPGFAGMREYLRRTADEGWIIDLSPEGHQPPVSSRVFKGNQQPICIAIFIRRGQADRTSPARVWHMAVHGSFDEKCEALGQLNVDSGTWEECAQDWISAFRPNRHSSWQMMPALSDLMPWAAPGVKTNRTWVYAPDRSTLVERWRVLISAPESSKAELFKESDSRKVDREIGQVPGMPEHSGTILGERRQLPNVREVAFRSFDRQYLIADARFIHRPSPPLWHTYSDDQVFVSEQHAHAIAAGPAITFSELLPDMHHHSGRGGRILPLYRDQHAGEPNILPRLLEYLTARLDIEISPLDLVAYCAGVVGHSGFTLKFSEELKRPGVRVPLSSEPGVWKKAIDLGREVVWLHTFGNRCVDETRGRNHAKPRLETNPPKVVATISDLPGEMPDQIRYDLETSSLLVGEGRICPVPVGVWEYRVAGMQVLNHWFGYRKKTPAGRKGSKLDEITPKMWTSNSTTKLLDLLHVLGRCVSLEPQQSELLELTLASGQILISDLQSAGLLPAPSTSTAAPNCSDSPTLW